MAFYKCDKKQNNGTGFRVDDVSNFEAELVTADEKIVLTWSDPSDFVIEGVVQAEWAGTIIVRKAFSEPTSTGDGTVVVNSTVRDQYSVNGFEDSDIGYNLTYYYKAFPYTTDGIITEGSTVSVESVTRLIYGAEWDGTASSSWTRTDAAADFVEPVPAINNGNGSSPFDSLLPWSGMARIEDEEAGTLVSIPKYYYKWTRDGSKMKLQISNDHLDGFSVSPAHADRGDGQGERDVVYVSAYHCVRNTYKSTSGQYLEQPLTPFADCRAAIHNLGTTIWNFDFAMYWTIAMLYLVEYADWNCQSKVGYGCSDEGNLQVTGLCDGMIYHTGTNAPSTTSYGHVRYRYIEDLWANMDVLIDGLYATNNEVFCIKNPANFDLYNGVKVSNYYSGSSECITSWTTPTTSGYEYALIPQTTNGTDYTIYCCDKGMKRTDVATVLATFGAGAYNSQAGGLFCIQFGLSSANTRYLSGLRLMKLP